jgi:hypothetical protein
MVFVKRSAIDERVLRFIFPDPEHEALERDLVGDLGELLAVHVLRIRIVVVKRLDERVLLRKRAGLPWLIKQGIEPVLIRVGSEPDLREQSELLVPMPSDAGFQHVEDFELDLAGFLDVAVRVFKRTEALVFRIGGLMVEIQKVDRRAVLEMNDVVFPVEPPITLWDVVIGADLRPGDERGLHEALQFLAPDE